VRCGQQCSVRKPVQAGDFVEGRDPVHMDSPVAALLLHEFHCAGTAPPPAPQSFDTRLPSTASRVPYCRNSLARGDSIRRHAAEQPIPQDQRVKQNSSKMGDEREE